MQAAALRGTPCTPLLVLLLVTTATAAAAASFGEAGSPSASVLARQSALSTELAGLARKGDALRLWERATASAADAVVEALRNHDSKYSVELKDVDMEELRIWHGQSVSLGVEVDGQKYSYMVQSEPDWQRLAHVLGSDEGGLLPGHDWDALDRDWLAPVSRGSLLPDSVLEGPLDVYLAQPTALQLFLPHASDSGVVKRVLLREGAVVVVRGARAVRLRRGLDLPAISLSEFAGIVSADMAQQHPLGVLHLLAGVQAAAQAHWNSSHPDQSLGLVALEIDFSQQSPALLAAPASDGSSSRRLRVRRVAEGAIELLPRDGMQHGAAAAAAAAGGAVALPASDAAGSVAGPWPLKSVHPAQLQSYEKLLRQVVSSRLFRTAPASKLNPQGMRVAQDVQLRLVETEAEATTVLQLQLELERRPKLPHPAGTAGGKASGKEGADGEAAADSEDAAASAGSVAGGSKGGSSSVGKASFGSAGEPVGAGKRSAAEVLASLEDPPGVLEALARAGQREGPFEEWTATVQIKGDAQRGTLQFVPLHLHRTDASADTVAFSPTALASLLGMGNSTEAEAAVVM